jgi:hypothetical protein
VTLANSAAISAMAKIEAVPLLPNSRALKVSSHFYWSKMLQMLEILQL